MRKIFVVALLAAAAGVSHADWQYQSQTDQMTGKEAKFALLESNHSLNLESPYAGRNMALITVRHHPKRGLDVLFRVEKGQILCRDYDDSCPVQVKFDAAAPIRFSGMGAADHDPRLVFIKDAKRFIALASKAKRILVQVNFFHNGAPVIEFHSSAPLQWTEPAAHKMTRPKKKTSAQPASGKSADECRAELGPSAENSAVVACLLGAAGGSTKK
jgi:hypothetical protein